MPLPKKPGMAGEGVKPVNSTQFPPQKPYIRPYSHGLFGVHKRTTNTPKFHKIQDYRTKMGEKRQTDTSEVSEYSYGGPLSCMDSYSEVIP
jgi:hypothetical protein